MSAEARFVEVIAVARVMRSVETYEAAIELSVSAGRRDSCLSESLSLREDVLSVLKAAGIDESDIQEGGGEIRQTDWSTSKCVRHRLAVRNGDMPTLIKAMAEVERLFVERKQPLFSRAKQSFTFHQPVPVYSYEGSFDESIRAAVRRSREAAESLANGAGVTLGPVLSIAECDVAAPKGSAAVGTESGFGAVVGFCSPGVDAMAEIPYTPAAQPSERSVRVFRVRFGVSEGREG